MVAIGRALMTEPRLLLLDEPSLGLAPQMVDVIFRVLEEIHGAGLALLLVEQNVQAALALAQRAYILEGGRVVGQGEGRALLADPAVRRAVPGASRARSVSAPPMGAALLAGTDLSKRFGGLEVLKGVTFAVRAREIVALIGPNGAGKTTLFNLVSGLVRPAAGDRSTSTARDITRRPRRMPSAGSASGAPSRRRVRSSTVGRRQRPGGRALRRRGRSRRRGRCWRSSGSADAGATSPPRRLPPGAPEARRAGHGLWPSDPVCILLDEILGGLTPAEAGRVVAPATAHPRRAAACALFWIDHVMWRGDGDRRPRDRAPPRRGDRRGRAAAVARDARVIEAYLGPAAAAA